MSRENEIVHFLTQCGLHTWRRTQLTGDASNRQYQRLFDSKSNNSMLLMDAPASKGEDVRPFVFIADFLSSKGFSVPTILNKDEKNGFLIIKDLGDVTLKSFVETQPEREMDGYQCALDVLLKLHRIEPPSGLIKYTPTIMAELASGIFDWYDLDQKFSDSKQTFFNLFESVLSTHAADYSVLAQRDFQSENIMWQEEKQGFERCGLLDFQDAVLGHPAYDLVSLLEDARRDVPKSVQHKMLDYYVDQSGVSDSEFRTAYSVLGAQRNLRILMVFARLSLYFGKPHYVDLIHRVWGYLMQDLEHPVLAEVKQFLIENLPEPTPSHLEELKRLCGTKTSL